MVLFGFGWLLAMLAIPVVVWIQMLRATPGWIGTTLLFAALVPLAGGWLLALVATLRRIGGAPRWGTQRWGTGTR